LWVIFASLNPDPDFEAKSETLITGNYPTEDHFLNEAMLFSDDVYEHMVFDNNKMIRVATLPDMWDRTITIGQFYKFNLHKSSVVDPDPNPDPTDPYFFGPPGSGSGSSSSQRYGKDPDPSIIKQK
jgi:hypothetical protein